MAATAAASRPIRGASGISAMRRSGSLMDFSGKRAFFFFNLLSLLTCVCNHICCRDRLACLRNKFLVSNVN